MKSINIMLIVIGSFALMNGAKATDVPRQTILGYLAQASGDPHHHHAHGERAYGQPGDATAIDRTIEMTALDSMRYQPDQLTVQSGETVRIVLTNAGKIRHELLIGDQEEQREHAEIMKQHADMVHDDPNGVTVEAGETKELIWRFGAPGQIEFACHVPGHYEAGMRAQVTIQPSEAN